MTGRIHNLDHANTAGSIKGESGQIIPFEFSVVLAYDVACLGVRQIVTFELRSEGCIHAVDVRVLKLNMRSDIKEKLQKQLPPRYLGFDQQGGVRSYRFEQILRDEENMTFTVTSELALFTKHHVGMQEGPAICLQLLMIQLASGETGQRRLNCSLADQDMLAHLARQPAPAAKHQAKRFLGAAGAASEPSI